LRGSLKAYSKSLGLGAEDVLTLEFMPAQKAPEEGPSIKNQDWVCALGLGEEILAAGLADGTLLLFHPKDFDSHSGGVKNVMQSAGLSHPGGVSGLDIHDPMQSNGDTLLSSAGKDGAVRLWRVSSIGTESKTPTSRWSLSLLGEFFDARGACNRVNFDPSGALIATGDAGGGVHVWDISKIAVRSTVSTKRQRTGSLATAPSPQSTPPLLALPSAHGGQVVSSVSWMSSEKLASSGWDGNVYQWDVVLIASNSQSPPVSTIHCGKTPTALASSLLGGVLATGHPDGSVRLWDSRVRGGGGVGDGGGLGTRGSLCPSSDTSAWVSDLAWCPAKAHLLAVADYGGLVRLWDSRAPSAPLATMTSHGGAKALCTRWAWAEAGGDLPMIFSGGADSEVKSAHF